MANNENIPNEDRQKLNSPAVPFFVRYLEGQLEDLSQEEAESISGGRCGNNLTRKYPSDNEDGIAVTLKFPSDQEDGSEAQPVTLKFPSDQEDVPGPDILK